MNKIYPTSIMIKIYFQLNIFNKVKSPSTNGRQAFYYFLIKELMVCKIFSEVG